MHREEGKESREDGGSRTAVLGQLKSYLGTWRPCASVPAVRQLLERTIV